MKKNKESYDNPIIVPIGTSVSIGELLYVLVCLTDIAWRTDASRADIISKLKLMRLAGADIKIRPAPSPSKIIAAVAIAIRNENCGLNELFSKGSVGHLSCTIVDSYVLRLTDDNTTIDLSFGVSKLSHKQTDPIVAFSGIHFTNSKVILWNCEQSAVYRYSEWPINDFISAMALQGSLWQIANPRHRVVFVRTFPFEISKQGKNNLVSPTPLLKALWAIIGSHEQGKGTLDEFITSQTIDSLGKHLSEKSTCKSQVMSLRKFINTLCEIKPGGFIREQGDVRMELFNPALSPLLKFSDKNIEETPTRSDYSVEYRAKRLKRYYSHDLLIMPDQNHTSWKEILQAMANIANVLAIRRNGLFRSSLSKRIFTLSLPGVIVSLSSFDCEFFMMPCLILYRKPSRTSFRTTMTLSWFVVPIEREQPDKQYPKFLPLKDLTKLNEVFSSESLLSNASIKITSMHGPLKTFFTNTPSSLYDLMEATFGLFLRKKLVDCPQSMKNRQFKTELAEILAQNQMSSVLVQVNWLRPQNEGMPWERFVRTGKDIAFRRALHRLIFFKDSRDDTNAHTTSKTTKFEDIQVSNSLGDDLGGMTFYEPDSETKYLIYPEEREKYPNYSILRWLGFAVYSDSGLSALRRLLSRLDSHVGSNLGLPGMLRNTEELVDDFAELYDFDIRRSIYRKEYQQLKRLSGIEADYQQLSLKVTNLTQAASLREQQSVNKILLFLTAVTLAVSVVTTVATISKWSLNQTLLVLIITVVLAVVFSMVGAGLVRAIDSRWK